MSRQGASLARHNFVCIRPPLVVAATDSRSVGVDLAWAYTTGRSNFFIALRIPQTEKIIKYKMNFFFLCRVLAS